MDTYEHLGRLEEQSQKLAGGSFSSEPATKAQIVELSTIVTELCTIVKRSLYPDRLSADRFQSK